MEQTSSTKGMFLASYTQLDMQFPQAAAGIFIEFAPNHYVVTSISVSHMALYLQYILMCAVKTFIT